MSLQIDVRPLAVVLLPLVALSLETIVSAAPLRAGNSSPAIRSIQNGHQLLPNATGTTIRLAAHRYGAGYYGHGGYWGAGNYYGGSRVYAYGNPYLYRGAYGGYGYYGAYRFAPYAYGGYGYYRPYRYLPAPYIYRPYAYTTPLSLYGVYGAPTYRSIVRPWQSRTAAVTTGKA